MISLKNILLKNSKVIGIKKYVINVKRYLVKFIYKFLVIGIIGNKYDLIEEEQVKQQEVEKFAQEINGIYGFTSAKDGTGIKDIIEKGFEMFVEKHSDTNKSKDNIILTETSKQSSCC